MFFITSVHTYWCLTQVSLHLCTFSSIRRSHFNRNPIYHCICSQSINACMCRLRTLCPSTCAHGQWFHCEWPKTEYANQIELEQMNLFFRCSQILIAYFRINHRGRRITDWKKNQSFFCYFAFQCVFFLLLLSSSLKIKIESIDLCCIEHMHSNTQRFFCWFPPCDCGSLPGSINHLFIYLFMQSMWNWR